MHPALIDVEEARQSSLRAAETGEDEEVFWRNKGKLFVKEKLNSQPNLSKAKNTILFMGDGMGLTTLVAARIELGGEEQFLSFENFPYTGLSKTYSVNHIVADSACTATALLCGVKTNFGTLGVNAKYPEGACNKAEEDNSVSSIAKWAQDAGKKTGLVTTTRVTHASPASLYASIQNRDWEYDGAVTAACGANSQIEDIGYQLIHGDTGSNLNVIFGGGKSMLVDKNIDPDGVRSDGRNLIDDFQKMSDKNVYVTNRDELLNIDISNADRVLGIFENSHMTYYMDKQADNKEPTLAEMTLKAIEILEQSGEGYFLFVEGGKIDTAHHLTQAKHALSETIEFSKAIEAAVKATNSSETLILTTADHSHTFSVSGYAKRGSDVFGVTGNIADDGLPYKTLSYGNGPSYSKYVNETTHLRINPSDVDQASDIFPATIPIIAETHGGEDVPVFASGPYAHLFTGVYEQHVIPHVMAYAMCIGSGIKACDN